MSVRPKILAFVVTITIIGILLFAGPVKAFVLDLTASDNDVIVGSIINFVANIQIDADEQLNVDYLVLDLDGPVSISCTFLPNGTKVTSCNGINIEKISGDLSPGYGYGYGYGLSGTNLTYNISLNTNDFPLGEYQTKLFLLSENNQFSQNGPNIKIRSEQANLEKCSVRADDGSITIDNNTLSGKSKLNFNIPASGAVNGKGSLTLQSGGKRFSYSFDIEDVLLNTATNSTILVNGEYKLNRSGKISQSATIYLDKKNKKVSVISDDFKVQNMIVDLLQGCK